MPQVQSTAIERIDYVDATETLYVTFHKSGTYSYLGVPRYVYDAFRAARSKGRFYAYRIRGRYREGERIKWAPGAVTETWAIA